MTTAERDGADEPAVGQTLRSRGIVEPMRAFLSTEASSAGVLLAAILAALVWANVDTSSYESFWRTPLAVRLGDMGIDRSLREWVNSGLMTLFFLVLGLEARRELDLGELRDRKRFLLPLTAGLVGMAVPVGLFLLVTLGSGDSGAWGVAMSTDTALALGFLALLGNGVSDRVRVFLLTAFVVDDLVALLVIAVAYSGPISVMPLVVALAFFLALLLALRFGIDVPAVYAVLGVIVWAAMLDSGVDPVVSGLAIGLAASAYSPSRDTLERATGLFRSFREQPTADLARTASIGLRAALSPNARLQRFYLPWTSYLIVPLFGLANAGFPLGGGFVGDALRSPVTLGIVLAYVVGKPVAVLGSSYVVSRFSGGRIRPPIGWVAVLGSGTIAGTAFTVSLLIAALAFPAGSPQLAQAKLGVLLASMVSVGLTALVFASTRLLSPAARTRALLGSAELLVDLEAEVDPERDHIRGCADADVTIVEYGDFECPYCGAAEGVARQELASDDDLRYVWRHLPLTDVHPHAQLAAEASEAAAEQGMFWELHDLLLTRQDHLTVRDLVAYAEELGLDVEQFRDDLKRHAHAGRVARDLESADLADVSGTPTFFINGRRHYGAFDLPTLRAAIASARERASI